MDGGFRHGFAKAFGEVSCPRARAIQQVARAHFQPLGAHDEARAVMFSGGDAHAFAYVGAQRGGGSRKGGRHQPGVGMAVFGAERSAHHVLS
ncbi:hypothetical protein D3C73_1277130 [compost metagenome]